MKCADHYKFLRKVHSESTTVDSLKDFRQANPNIHWSSVLYPETGDSILHICARLNKCDLINYILTEWLPMKVDFKNKDCKTGLHEAAQSSHIDAVKLLLEFDAEVDALKRADWTPLMLACTKTGPNALDVVKYLLDKKADTYLYNKDGWLPLHLACRAGDIAIVTELLKRDPQTACMATTNGKTVFHITCLHGHIDLLKLILKKSSMYIETTDKAGNTPFHEAVCSGNIQLIDLLLHTGATQGSVNSVGFTGLHFAAAQGLINVITHIIKEYHMDPNIRSKTGLTPLHCAAKHKHLEAFECLKSLGANEKQKDNHGRTPADYLSM